MREQEANTWWESTDDPVRFAREALNIEATPQQREFLEAIARPGARVAVRSGHGTGKSTALSIAALWFLSTRKDALVPCTAPTGHQLGDILWRELRRLIAAMPEEVRRDYAVTADRILRKGSAGMIVARTSRPENPDALQGFHAEELLFVIDEAAGVGDTVFEVARGALSTPSARVALAGNPTRLNGYFHNAFHIARDNWTLLHFSCLDSPLVSREYPLEIAGEYGEDSDMYRVRVLGEFPRRGIDNLISLELVDAAMAQHPHPADPQIARILGVDPAWKGTDRSAAVLRQGSHAYTVFARRGVDTVVLADMVARQAAELNVDAIIVDQTGVGAGVLDQLQRTNYRVIGVALGGRALNPERFLNRRAEMWWALRVWLEGCPSLAADGDMRDDLIAPEFGYTAMGKIQLESKDSMRARGVSSPDLGDALALTFAAPVRPRSMDAGMPAEPYNVYDWMERN